MSWRLKHRVHVLTLWLNSCALPTDSHSSFRVSHWQALALGTDRKEGVLFTMRTAEADRWQDVTSWGVCTAGQFQWRHHIPPWECVMRVGRRSRRKCCCWVLSHRLLMQTFPPSYSGSSVLTGYPGLPGVLRAAALVCLTTLFSQIAYRSVTELIVKDDLTRLGVSRNGLKNERSNYFGAKIFSTLNPISCKVNTRKSINMHYKP